MKKFRIVEIFGPTIQGEGRHIGAPCYFIRFAGCDYRCTWCDSPHAVLPHLVNEAERIDEKEIIRRVSVLPSGPKWIVFSGGNPALLDLRGLVIALRQRGFEIMVETQGTIYRDWLRGIDELCISPKPPSSGMEYTHEMLESFVNEFPYWWIAQNAYLKIPIFNTIDYEWAHDIHRAFDLEMFLSLGNVDPNLPTVGNNAVGDPNAPLNMHHYLVNLRRLMEKVAGDPHMHDVRVLPQLHVLAWGNERGR